MSEVDRLSNSGLYPALPIADQRRGKDDPGAGGKPPADERERNPDSAAPRPPKSIIDEYA